MLFAATWLPSFGLIANDYRAVIAGYLAARASRRLADRAPDSRQIKGLLDRTIEELAALDERRARLVSRLAAASARSEEAPLTPQ